MFTYTDYLSWPDAERWELIDGVLFDVRLAEANETDRQTLQEIKLEPIF